MLEDPNMAGKPEEVPNNGDTNEDEEKANSDEDTKDNDVAKDA